MARVRFCLILILYFKYFLFDTNAQLKIVTSSEHGFPDPIKLEYRCPKGFTEHDTVQNFVPFNSNGGYIGATFYYIESEHKDIAIMFRPMMIISKEDSIKLYKSLFFTYQNPNPPLRNTTYIKVISLRADSSWFTPIHYTKKYSKQKFNADHAGMFHLRQTNSYLDRYDKCRVVFLQKNDRGCVELYYFYTSTNAGKVDKYIKQTEGMIRFKD